MKEKTIIPILLVAFALTSCTQSYVQRVSADYWKVIDITIPASSWNYDENSGVQPYYWATVDVPEITKAVYEDGFVMCYLVDGNAQMPLPYVRHYKNTNNETWTTTTDYQYSIGGITLFYTNSDFNYLTGEPGAMKMRLVLEW